MKKYILFIVLIPLLTACKPKVAEPEAAGENKGEIHSFITLSKAQYAQAGIQLGTFSRRLMQEFIPATAELFLATEYTASVSTLTEGVVAELKVSLNQQVRKGDVVAVLQKPGLLDLQQSYLEWKDRLPFLKAEYERYKMLSGENATAAKNFQKAESELKEAQSALAVIVAKLRQFQLDPEQVHVGNLKSTLSLRAPMSGTVTQVHVGVGASLSAGMALCSISDYSKIQPVVYIFEKDIFRVKPGVKVLLHFAADPTRSFPATITSIEGAIDPQRKAVRAFARFDAPVPGLVSGVYMEARIAPVPGRESQVLPEEAVVREGDGQYIFLLSSRNEEGYVFHKVSVKTGAKESGLIAVTPLEPLPENPDIVLKGAYYVSAQGSGIEADE